ncbi:hypothetical protein C1645_836761 [Glomus cerebriforme]|uniref:Uncharacterized protein n=1 Tax=Glomus cerebriforme TaxID=658196 RepID=A0A397SA34_9GLOM|nr:hypothetical protein C1645_836761 [Glomus cerebriforme]
MRNEYVSTILHTALNNQGGREPSMRYRRQEKTKRTDEDDFDYLYGIVTTARDWHFLLYSPGEILQASELPVTIEYNKKALDKDSSAY